MNKKFLHGAVIILIPLLSLSNYLYAVGSAGIENSSFSAKSLAHGNAVVAQADEPAAISYNPAGIVNLPGLQIQPNLHFISMFTFFRSRTPDTVPGEKSSGTVVPVPTGYMTLNPGDLLDNRVAFGIGSDSPFGLMNKYDAGHPIVRYAGWRNWFNMYTIKPVVAFKLLDWLSIGAGPMWYRVYDWGGIQNYPNSLAGSAAADGQVRLNLSGNHWGWQGGLLARPHWRHSFGFYFRSPVVVNTSGLAKVERSAFAGNFETGAYAKYNLPLNFTWAYAFKPNKRSTVEFDFGYTRWSTLHRLFIDHDFVSAGDAIVINAIGRNAKDFRDSFSYHLGGNYQLTKNLKVSMGGWYYTHAAPNSSYIPAVPDGDRLGVATGTSYQIHKNIVLDLSYLNVWNLSKHINNDIGTALGVSEDGRYLSYLQEFSISVTYKWDNIFDHVKRMAGIKQSERIPATEAPSVA